MACMFGLSYKTVKNSSIQLEKVNENLFSLSNEGKCQVKQSPKVNLVHV